MDGNSNQTIPVVLGSSDIYLKYAAVTIQSVLENCSPDYQYKFYMLVDSNKVTPEKREEFLKIRTARNVKFDIEFLSINDDSLPDLPVIAQISRESYFRLLIPELISWDKVIYLDCDVIVRQDISLLFNHDLGNNLVAAVRDMFPLDFKRYVETLNLNPDNYFNAGVMIINNRLWKEQDIGRQCVNYLIEHPDIKFMDQDAMNIICRDRVLYLDRRWNYIWYYSIEMVRLKGLLDPENQEIYRKLTQDFNIIHYTSAYKPWKNRYFKFADLWWKYARMTSYYKQLFWGSELISRQFFRKLIGVNNIRISGEKYKILYLFFIKILFKA